VFLESVCWEGSPMRASLVGRTLSQGTIRERLPHTEGGGFVKVVMVVSRRMLG